MAKAPIAVSLSSGLSCDDALVLRNIMGRVLRQPCFGEGELPLIAPAMLLGTPGLEAVSRHMQAPPGMAVVHESQMVRRSGCLPLGAPLKIRAGIMGSEEAPRFEFSLLDHDRVIGDMQTRLRFVTPDLMRALKGSEFRPAMIGPDGMWFETDILGESVVEAYLALAHDPNPLHRDDEAARLAGLTRAVVPGMLIAGLSEAALALRAFKAVEMRARFLAPLPIGESLRFAVTLRSGEGGQRARVFAVNNQNMIMAITDFSAPS